MGTTVNNDVLSEFSYSNNEFSKEIEQNVQNSGLLSPYLNQDLSFKSPISLPASPEYIFPEGAVHERGRFELSFSQIGGACITGGLLGGINGLYKGFQSTSKAGLQGKLRRIQLVNHMMKHGSSAANSIGMLAFMYGGIGALLSIGRGCDDELNTLTAATATGLLYKSTAGLKKCGIGGGIGFSLAALYCLCSAHDQLLGFQNG